MARLPSPDVEQWVLRYARSEPELGQFSVAARLQEHGLQISASGVRAIWKRHNLETLYKRLEDLSRGRGEAGAALTELQSLRLDRARRRRQLHRREAPGQREGQGSDTAGLLLHAAAREFLAHGYKGASLKEIGERAGLLPGSLYHYFRSKEDLLTQVHHAGFVQLNEALDEALAGREDPLDRFRSACRAHVELLVSGNALAAFTGTTLYVPDSRSLKKQMRRDRKEYEERFRRLIDALPLGPGVDRSLLRLGLFGALNWTRIWYRPGRREPSEIADEFVRIFARPAAGQAGHGGPDD
jgi:AcrR family transcriptional regulator